jgi:hypothetical protein
MRNTDRTVHARLIDGTEVVRYDRAGKWYLEHQGIGSRIPVNLNSAVIAATSNPANVIYSRVPGGTQFDAAVRRLQA